MKPLEARLDALEERISQLEAEVETLRDEIDQNRIDARKELDAAMYSVAGDTRDLDGRITDLERAP